MLVSSAAAANAASALVKIVASCHGHVKSHRQPLFHRLALLSPVSQTSITQWNQPLSCWTSLDFYVALNFDRSSFFGALLPASKVQREAPNYGSPYRKGPKVCKRRCTVTSVDLLGLLLWYLKSSGRQYNLHTVFGLITLFVNVWIDYEIGVMYYVCCKKLCLALRVT